MSFTRKWQTRVSAIACATMSTLLVLACGASAVKAEGIVPVEGGWVATTSAGLPVSFEVKGGNVLSAHFRFNWGFCGTYESHLPNTNPIDADGHWSFVDSRGQTIAATFVAPNRAEGTVVAVERQLPGCPRTEATFVAAPGEVPPYVKPQAFAVQNVNTGHISRRPGEIVLGKRAPSLSMPSGGGASAVVGRMRSARPRSARAGGNGTRGPRCGSASWSKPAPTDGSTRSSATPCVDPFPAASIATAFG